MNNTPYNPLEGQKAELVLPLQDSSDQQISIIVVHRDRPEYLNICLQSIAVTSFNNNYEIIVVDNASGEESQEFLNQLEGDIKIVRNDKNLYWSEACNRGVAAADKNSKYLVFMHCDVVIEHPSWLDMLIQAAETRNTGFLGVEASNYNMSNQRVDFIQEWLIMFSRECWEDIKPWPKELPLIGHSFIMTLKAQRSGHKPQYLSTKIAHHYKIFSVDINDYERLSQIGRAHV
jgi:GT2 family glycosyltransferase